MKSTFLVVLFIVVSISSYGQHDLEIKSVIGKMFDGMARGDSAIVHNVMDNQCSLKSVIRKKDGNTIVNDESLSDFLNFVGAPLKSKIEERLLSYEIKLDGDMAMVWTPYKFYIDDKISHCGVNVFMLAKKNSAWQIISITDTRRRECDE